MSCGCFERVCVPVAGLHRSLWAVCRAFSWPFPCASSPLCLFKKERRPRALKSMPVSRGLQDTFVMCMLMFANAQR